MEAGARDATRLRRPFDVVAGAFRQAARQVAVGTLRQAVGETRVEFEPARQAAVARQPGGVAGTGRPGRAQLATRVGVRELRVAHLHRDPGQAAGHRLDAPHELRGQLVKRQQRVVEDAGQIERTTVQADTGFSAGLGRVELQVRVAQARAADAVRIGRRPRSQRQATEPALRAVVQRRIERAVPARVELADHAPRAQLGEQALQGITERHARRHLRHQPDIEPLRAELAAGRRLALALAPGKLHVALRPADAIAGQEGEALQRQRHALGIALGLQAAFEFFDAQGLDLGAQAQRDGAQRNVHARGDRRAVLYIEPAAQRADALAQLERQGHMLAQRMHVGAWQARIHRAAPALPVAAAGEQRLRQAADHAEALAPVGWRRGIEAHLVLAQAVAKHQLHIAQRERRGGALFIDPAQCAAAHDDLVLLEEPVCSSAAMAAVGSAEIEAGDEDSATRVTPNFKLGAVDQQLLEAQFEGQQRVR